MEKASKIFEVEFTSKGSKLYRWTHISKEDEKLFKPFNILSVRSYSIFGKFIFVK
jgi:hypothetical protein